MTTVATQRDGCRNLTMRAGAASGPLHPADALDDGASERWSC